jgi:hypothetical protein
MTQRELFFQAMQARLGRPYIYGGQGPDYFDCSGYVLDCLLQTGMKLPDMNAQGIYDWFHNNKVLLSASPVGSLAFYWNKLHNYISHTMCVYSIWPNGERVLCGARGGDNTTTDLSMAAQQGALCSLVVASHYQPELLALVCDPFRGMD